MSKTYFFNTVIVLDVLTFFQKHALGSTSSKTLWTKAQTKAPSSIDCTPASFRDKEKYWHGNPAMNTSTYLSNIFQNCFLSDRIFSSVFIHVWLFSLLMTLRSGLRNSILNWRLHSQTPMWPSRIFAFQHSSGVIKFTYFGEIKQCKCIVNLKDFPCNSALFGLVSYNDPCSLQCLDSKPKRLVYATIFAILLPAWGLILLHLSWTAR